jgi:hypothetical protein
VAILPPGVYRAVEEHDALVLVLNEQNDELVLVDTSSNEAPIVLKTTATFFDWTQDGFVYGTPLEVHHLNVDSGIDTLVTRSGDTIVDAHLIGGQTYLIALEDPVTTVLLQGFQIKRAWLSKDKKTAFIKAGGVAPGAPLWELPLVE